MKRHVLISVSAITLIAGAGLANAQERGGPGAPGGGASQPPSVQQRGGESPSGGMNQRGEQPQRQDQPQRMDQRNERGQQGAQEQRQNQRDNRAQEKASPDSKKGATTGQGSASTSGGAALSTEQRSKISTTIKQGNARPVTNVNFNVSVGTVVPRSVTLYPLPAAVIEIHPQWRGYQYVLVGDEIVIIEPGSHRIVAVIDA